MSQRDHTPEEIAEFKKDNPQNFPPEPTVAEQLLDDDIERKLAKQRAEQRAEEFNQAQTTRSLPEGQSGGAAQVPVLHVASERAHRAATNAVHELGCGVVTIVFDVTGAYQFRSGDINVTYAIGLLHRAILSLQNTAQATPFR